MSISSLQSANWLDIQCNTVIASTLNGNATNSNIIQCNNVIVNDTLQCNYLETTVTNPFMAFNMGAVNFFGNGAQPDVNVQYTFLNGFIILNISMIYDTPDGGVTEVISFANDLPFQLTPQFTVYSPVILYDETVPAIIFGSIIILNNGTMTINVQNAPADEHEIAINATIIYAPN